MNQYVPAHKHVGDEGKPGQIVNYPACPPTRRRDDTFHGPVLAYSVTWDNPMRSYNTVQAVAYIRKALDSGAALQDILRLI